jgi:hypothetical protein
MEIATRRREQEVWQACDDLWALYGEPGSLTGEAIKERLVTLGKSRGSPNEIYKYRKTWEQSRGLNNKGTEARSFAEDDPITRAVRLVHEKLAAEAEEQIAAISQSSEARVAELEQLLESEKKNVAQTLHEYNQLLHKLDETKADLKNHENLLVAETTVRQACERELQQNRLIMQDKEQAHERLLQELTKQHQSEVLRMQSENSIMRDEAKRRELALVEELKKKGAEFSEELNLMRTANYNAQILAQKYSQETVILKEKQALLEGHFEQQLAALHQQIDEHKVSMSHAHAQWHHAAARLTESARERRKLATTLKKCELRLARLRAMLKVEAIR